MIFRLCLSEAIITALKEFHQSKKRNVHNKARTKSASDALNIYFLTKKQENTAINKDKLETEKRKRASYERKKEKAKRRITVLERMEISAVKKAKIRPALENKYMSSEEECADGFVTHQPSWQSEKFAEYKRKLDSKFLDICSTKSRRLLSKRTIGSASEKETPDIKDETHGL
ncbi:unnamed protein product [Mytilus coruscus]|uniref:Uncharacterized protein n=1 Tax=Mytilus coruscus TaxID=42192 RepID=A0A6J8F0F4_MYTCO|nr:unnamed protein product [Mytilus coruscus]